MHLPSVRVAWFLFAHRRECSALLGKVLLFQISFLFKNGPIFIEKFSKVRRWMSVSSKGGKILGGSSRRSLGPVH